MRTKSVITSVIVCALASMVSPQAYSAWVEASGTVEEIALYDHTDTVLVTLSSHGMPVAECSNTVRFALSKHSNTERRNRFMSVLLMAQASGQSVTIAYNESGSCEPWDANPAVFRIVKRLRFRG